MLLEELLMLIWPLTLPLATTVALTNTPLHDSSTTQIGLGTATGQCRAYREAAFSLERLGEALLGGLGSHESNSTDQPKTKILV